MSWFGNAQSWPLVPLKDISTLKRGYDLPVDQRNAGNVPIYAANGQNGSHDDAKIKAPGVVTGRSGTIGKVHYVEEDYWPLNTALYVTNFHENDPKWVYYMLRAFRLERFVEGAGVPTLNRNLVHGELIPLPPLPEQQRIAAILDKADAIRRKRQQAIELADEFLRAVFLDMFGDPVANPKGWEVANVGSICDIQGGIQVSAKRDQYDFRKPYLRVANVLRNELALNEIKYIGLTESEYQRVKLKKDDILVVEGHGNKNEIGRSAIWNGNISECVHQNHLIRIRITSEKILPLLLNNFINSQGGREQMFKTSNTTSGLNTISTNIVRNIKTILPPIELQREFAARVQKTEGLKAKLKASLAQADEQFNALSQRAFAGKL